MDEITLELIKVILGFGSNLILLGIGASFAKYTVNQYQKRKDSFNIRESLSKNLTEIYLEYNNIMDEIEALNHYRQNSERYSEFYSPSEELNIQ